MLPVFLQYRVFWLSVAFAIGGQESVLEEKFYSVSFVSRILLGLQCSILPQKWYDNSGYSRKNSNRFF